MSQAADAAALGGIRLYQRYLSPHKGFRCACAALHGGESCSAAVSRIIREDGLRAGRPRIRAQFQKCREAHNTLLMTSPMGGPGRVQGGVQGVFCCGPIPIPFRCGG
ncbi:membrane protein insertion efficiency factor YidD [Deinococcus lacus]|uniref:Membrane protein insertion efficiency factor YidD n=1 Tax=Deinococcus lacus TaxID=392561 RepID=A0ABW1YBS8_9DEIO